MTTTPTDTQLQLALAKMLPEKIKHLSPGEDVNQLLQTTIDRFYWISKFKNNWNEIKDTEWLHVCWLIELTLMDAQWDRYLQLLAFIVRNPKQTDIRIRQYTNATWQQRAQALAQVKGVEVVC